jgi:iron(III) transport system permease protein
LSALPLDAGIAVRLAPAARSGWRLSWVASAALVVSLLALLPLGFVLWVGVQTGWDTASALIFRPRVGELLVNTALLVALTVPLCAVLAVALAWLTERSDLPGARTWAWLLVAPLAVPAFVHSYAWMTVAPGLHGLPAGVMVSVIAYFPFLYLPVAAACAGWTRAWKTAPPRWALAPGRCSFASCCRSCGWRYAAARCWWGFTCWPNTACT